MTEVDVVSCVVRFGPFELDVVERRLLKHGHRIKLQGQPFRVLCRLVQQPHELVSREELRRELWPDDTFVDFDHSLNEAVNKLRAALGDSATRPVFVETVPRHGYRLIADVERLPKTAPKDQEEDRAPKARSLAWLPAAAGIVVAALLLVALRSWTAGPTPVRSIAVLPFDNLSGDPEQDYLAEGMTDELIGRLSRVEALRVISRASILQYRGSAKSLPTIGRELRVDHVIDGTVRLTGERIRVTAYLDDVATGTSLWTETYEGTTTEIFQIQDLVAQTIAAKVSVELTEQDRQRLSPRVARPATAYQAYLKGRHHWNQRTGRGFDRAVLSFQEALELEPSYAEAYAGLADAFSLSAVYNLKRPHEVMPLAKDAAEAAIRLEPTLAEAHASLGHILFLYDWNWVEAESELCAALSLNPGYATAHQWYGVLLVARNRTDEGLAELRDALDRNPLSLAANENLGWALYVSRRDEEAVEQFQATLDLDPNYGQALRYLGLTSLRLGRQEQALDLLERALDALGKESEITADLALAYALAGDQERAGTMLDDLIQTSKTSYVSPYLIASFHTGLGNVDEAIYWLERAFDERIANLVFLHVDPFFDSLRPDPRFRSLIERIGLDSP